MKSVLENTECRCCGMSCAPLEFHPYAACLMFRSCRNGDTVRANLNFVVLYGKNLAQHRVEMTEKDSAP